MDEEQEIFCFYPSGRMARLGVPRVSGFEEKIAWFAENHPTLIWFFADAGTVQPN